MKKILMDKNGYALITTLFILILISIFGLAIISITTSNFYMTKVDSRSQSSYYIAEAGVNYVIDKINTEAHRNVSKYETSEEFFENLEDHFLRNAFILDNFEINNGQQPKAIINVSRVSMDEDTRDYEIESVGKIGKSTRTVSSIISVNWNKQVNDSTLDLILYTNKFTFKGSEINAPGKTIVISGHDKDSLNGESRINVKNIYFKQLKDGILSGRTFGDKNDPGDIYLDGNAKILSSGRVMYGNVHTNGDFIVTGGVSIYGDLYVGGAFEANGGTTIYGDLYVKDDFKFHGCTINGNVIVGGDVDAEGGGKINGNLITEGNMTISGGAVIKGELDVSGNFDATGGAVIDGKLNVGGNAKFVSVTLNSDANVDGNIELGWTPTFNKVIHYTGTLKAPPNFNQNILIKCLKVETVPIIPKVQHPDYSFEVPDCSISLKPDSWFVDNGYVIKGNETGTIPHNAKMLVDNYNNNNWQKVTGQVIIVSKGDIILRGDKNFTGALIAPNGKVVYSGGGTFDGIIISKHEINLKAGGTTFNFKSLEEIFGEQIPIITTCTDIGEGTGGSNNHEQYSVKVTIQSGVKEK